MTLKNNRAPLLCYYQLCASFHHHMWIQTGVTVRKRLNGIMTFVTLTFHLWPWPFAWTSLLSLVITPENFMMIRWEEHCEKGVTDRRTDRQTEITVLRAAWSQLKTHERCGPPVCFPITNSFPQCHGIFTMAEVTIGFHSMRQCVIIMGVGACCVWPVFMALGSSIL